MRIVRLLAGWLFAGCAVAAEPLRPNIVFILADDIGVGETGCFGGTAIPTPHIDRLAREGLRFTSAYAGSAVCAPTRCVLMTGLHTGHALRRANESKDGLLPLPAGTTTLARMLKGAGYSTGGFGKWGLGNEGTTGAAEKQGFDVFYGYYDQVHAHGYFPEELVRNGVREKLPGNANVARGEYSHDLIEGETLRFIEANREGPFFCYAAWTLPHAKYEIPSHAQFADRPWTETLKIRAAMIARLDLAVGNVMAKLKSLGLEERTLVIFTSDNGPDLAYRDVFNGTAGLRGYKRTLYEGGVRAPLIARWRERVAAGGVTEAITSQIDWMPTLAELAGVPAPANDGISLAPLLLGRGTLPERDALYWEIYEGPATFQQAVRMGEWKGFRTGTKAPLELYRLSDDPTERRDVAAAYPEVVRRVEEIMRREHVPSPHWATTEQASWKSTQRP